MADRLAASWRGRGDTIELHKFEGRPHTFIPRDTGSDAAKRATELIIGFVERQARGNPPA